VNIGRLPNPRLARLHHAAWRPTSSRATLPGLVALVNIRGEDGGGGDRRAGLSAGARDLKRGHDLPASASMTKPVVAAATLDPGRGMQAAARRSGRRFPA